MVEYLQISCPSCQRTLRVRKQYVGLTVACTHCGYSFPVEQPPEPGETVPHAERPAPQAISETDRESYEKQIAELARELEDTRSEVQQSRDERTFAAEQLLRRDAERDQLADRIKELTAELEQLREQAQVDAVLRDELADSAAEVEQLRQEAATLRQELDRVARDAAQAHDRANEMAEEIQSLESKLAQPATPTDTTSDQQPVDELRGQLRQLQVQNEELRAVIKGLGITVG